MQIIAASLQKTADSFLHAGYISVQGYAGVLLPGAVSFVVVAMALEFCKSKAWISDGIAKTIAVIYILILFFLAAIVGHPPSPRPG